MGIFQNSYRVLNQIRPQAESFINIRIKKSAPYFYDADFLYQINFCINMTRGPVRS